MNKRLACALFIVTAVSAVVGSHYPISAIALFVLGSFLATESLYFRTERLTLPDLFPECQWDDFRGRGPEWVRVYRQSVIEVGLRGLCLSWRKDPVFVRQVGVLVGRELHPDV